MTRIASAGQQPSREGSADWETGASPNGPMPRTLATPSRRRALETRARVRECRQQWDACGSSEDRRAMALGLGISIGTLHNIAREFGWPVARRGYTIKGKSITTTIVFPSPGKMRRQRQRPTSLPLEAYQEARRLWDSGLGSMRIAHELVRQGIVGGTSKSIAQRVHKISQRESWPARTPSKWDRYPPEKTRRIVSARNEEEKQARYEEALRLRRPDTPCAWCDCTRPGRACIECGRVAPGRQA